MKDTSIHSEKNVTFKINKHSWSSVKSTIHLNKVYNNKKEVAVVNKKLLLYYTEPRLLMFQSYFNQDLLLQLLTDSVLRHRLHKCKVHCHSLCIWREDGS